MRREGDWQSADKCGGSAKTKPSAIRERNKKYFSHNPGSRETCHVKTCDKIRIKLSTPEAFGSPLVFV
jgi:hypothetical protein